VSRHSAQSLFPKPGRYGVHCPQGESATPAHRERDLVYGVLTLIPEAFSVKSKFLVAGLVAGIALDLFSGAAVAACV
ncbi:hypothetical protein SB861_69725, partial [Paraburkholderia sp. SIMBA_049]